MRHSVSTLALLSSLLVGCGGSSLAGISEQEVTLTVSSVGEKVVHGQGPAIDLSRARLRLSAMELVPCRSGAASVVLEPRSYELMSTPAPSEVVSTSVPELCSLRIELEPDSNVEGQAGEATLWVEGIATNGLARLFFANFTASLTFATDSAHSFGEQPLLLGIDLPKWLGDLPLNDTVNDDNSSEDLAAQLKDAAALYVDKNGNGRLDENESTPLLTSTQ
jgi:hypothetical protein